MENYPKLEGTEKQVKWAIDIRKKMIEEVKEQFDPKEWGVEYEGDIEIIENYLKNITEAKFFIEHRFTPALILKKLALKIDLKSIIHNERVIEDRKNTLARWGIVS